MCRNGIIRCRNYTVKSKKKYKFFKKLCENNQNQERRSSRQRRSSSQKRSTDFAKMIKDSENLARKLGYIH